MKSLLKFLLKTILPRAIIERLSCFMGFNNEYYKNPFANEKELGKATNYIERFREIVSDPINLLIERVPSAGYLDENRNVILHNGTRVPIDGNGSYYGRFSEILIINRGVHEPLEEYCFQELLKYLSKDDKIHTMLELGAYWGHYSLWFSKVLKNTHCTLVEPEKINIDAGKKNFQQNGKEAVFIQEFVSNQGFTVDKFFYQNPSRVSDLTLLHSDIQGFEEEMLLNSEKALSEKKIQYLMISTHGKTIHENCLSIIQRHKYIVSVDSEPISHTTSSDGFIFAHLADYDGIVNYKEIFGRMEIAQKTANEKLRYLNDLLERPNYK